MRMTRQDSCPTKAEHWSWILDTHGQAQDDVARNVINARRAGNTETRAVCNTQNSIT
jgi:hypothetical protein